MADLLDEALDLDDYLHELLANAQAVNDMADTAGWQHIRDVCNRMLFQIGDKILSGRVTDTTDYIKLTSFREGVLFVLGAVDRANKSVRDARDQIRNLEPPAQTEVEA